MFVGIETDSGFWVAEAPVDDTEVEELREMKGTKVMRVEPTAESNLHQVCVMLMFVVI